MRIGVLKEYVSRYMSYSLNSLKGGYIGDHIGTIKGDIKEDTRSLDYSSYGVSIRGDKPVQGYQARASFMGEV